MTTELIIGISGIGLTIVLLVLTIGSFLWMARNDYRHLDAKIDAFQKQWAEESRDFHGRLVALETDFKSFMKREEEKRTAHILKHQ